MGRVWTLAGALALGCLLIYLTVGFMGVTTLKFASAIVGAGAVAAYLPGGRIKTAPPPSRPAHPRLRG